MPPHAERATKVCPVCGLPFQWRKKWKDCWDEVRYCSERCRRRRQEASPDGTARVSTRTDALAMTLPLLPLVLVWGKALGPLSVLMATLLLGGPLVGPGQAAGERATVISIGDGDTIRVLQGQQRITVRLACNRCAEA